MLRLSNNDVIFSIVSILISSRFCILKISEDLFTSLLESLNTLQKSHQLQQLDENGRVVSKEILDKAVKQVIQSHMKTVAERTSASQRTTCPDAATESSTVLALLK
ncbi:uncharacterized protein LOC113291199 [Papaver somniferum]|uniref:uncharacterized protein LOC113291199 n=1 Tax=Papaver somniferum TaxID=3469 RepID=UPI000E705A6A|nr:uncharacterized protein LOC113291199 [Papaver somniferum]